MSKRLTVAQFAKAHKVVTARGWKAAAGAYCDKWDQRVCPVAALAMAGYKRFPGAITGGTARRRLTKQYGVSGPYVDGIISGVDGDDFTDQFDDPGERKEYAAGFKLGRKLYTKFIQHASA